MKEIIFLLNLDTHRITGGTRLIYRLAEALHSSGMPVAISSASHTPPIPIAGEALNCRTLTLQQTADLPPESRILVIPDDVMLRFNDRNTISGIEIDLSAGKFVLISQNRRDIMKSFLDIWPKRLKGISLANHKNCLGCITVSAHEQEIWQAIFPNLKGWVVPNSIDCTVFGPAAKRPTIVYSEKGGAERTEIRTALLLIRHAQVFKGYAFKFLYGLSQPDLAAELAQASIYLQASQYESFGLLAGEAIASGCIFAGSDGGAHAAFLSDDWAYKCGPCNTLGMVQALRRLDHDLRHTPDLIEEKRRLGRAFVQATYTKAQQSLIAQSTFKDIAERAELAD